MLKLYYSPNTCALASLITLEEAGADYEISRVDFSREEQRGPEYLEINAKGRVPALATDDGIITETPAILTFIAQSFPNANLIPNDVAGFARVQEFNSYLCSTVHPAHAHRVRGHRWADFLFSEPERAEFHGELRLLIVAGGHPPRLPERAQRRV